MPIQQNWTLDDAGISYAFIYFTITMPKYEGWNFNSGNYLFTTDTK